MSIPIGQIRRRESTWLHDSIRDALLDRFDQCIYLKRYNDCAVALLVIGFILRLGPFGIHTVSVFHEIFHSFGAGMGARVTEMTAIWISTENARTRRAQSRTAGSSRSGTSRGASRSHPRPSAQATRHSDRGRS